MTEKRRKEQATGAAVGAGGAALAMPTRVRSNAKSNPYKNLPERQKPHSVPMKDVHRSARNTGHRRQNTAYTYDGARKVQSGELPRGELKVNVYRDGHAHQVDGAHSTWQRSLIGDKKMDVKVTRVDGPRPTKTLAGNISSEIRSARHRRRLKRTHDLANKNPKKFNAKADELAPGVVEQNKEISAFRDSQARWKGKASAEGKYDPGTKVGMSTGKLRTRQGQFLVGGAAAGAGAVALAQKSGFNRRKDDVKKSASVSAFGVEHNTEISKGIPKGLERLAQKGGGRLDPISIKARARAHRSGQVAAKKKAIYGKVNGDVVSDIKAGRQARHTSRGGL